MKYFFYSCIFFYLSVFLCFRCISPQLHIGFLSVLQALPFELSFFYIEYICTFEYRSIALVYNLSFSTYSIFSCHSSQLFFGLKINDSTRRQFGRYAWYMLWFFYQLFLRSQQSWTLHVHLLPGQCRDIRTFNSVFITSSCHAILPLHNIKLIL